MSMITPMACHVHAKHPSQRGDVKGFRIVTFEFREGQWDVFVTTDNVEMISYDDLAELVKPRKLEIVPFGVLNECCDLNKG